MNLKSQVKELIKVIKALQVLTSNEHITEEVKVVFTIEQPKTLKPHEEDKFTQDFLDSVEKIADEYDVKFLEHYVYVKGKFEINIQG